MYPPPDPNIVHRIDGSAVEVVCFGKYTAHLGFEDGSRITFGCPFRFASSASVDSAPVTEFPLDDASLISLIGEAVTVAGIDPDGTLDLRFSSGHTLVLYANDPSYEAYTLLIDGKEYLV